MRHQRLLPIVLSAVLTACTSPPEPASASSPPTPIAATSPPSAPRPVVVLMTDFGTRDDAAAILRGVVISIARDAAVLDLSHDIPRFDIAEGARALADAPGVFPAGTVFVCVVDPGVGTSRKAIAMRLKNGRTLVGPDNGLLSLAAEKWGVDEAREIQDARFLAKEVSPTFHGRDVFAPAGARLALGVPPFSEIGPVVGTWQRLDAPPPVVEGGAVKGVIASIDEPFGNLWTNVSVRVLESVGLKKGDRVVVELPGRTLEAPWVETFGDVKEGAPLVYVNSRGTIGLAINMGDAARTLGVKRGDPVRITKPR